MLFTSEEGVYFLKNRRPFARPEEHTSRWKQQDAPSSGQTGAWRCQRPVFVTTGLGELTSFAPYCPIPGPHSDFISCPTNVLEKKRDSFSGLQPEGRGPAAPTRHSLRLSSLDVFPLKSTGWCSAACSSAGAAASPWSVITWWLSGGDLPTSPPRSWLIPLYPTDS